MNTFAIENDEYYQVCYKVNDAKTFKNLDIILNLLIILKHVYYRLAHLNGAFKLDLVLCIIRYH